MSSQSKPSREPLVDGKWGHVVYTVHFHGPLAGTVTIDQADPHALVLDEILHEALAPRRTVRTSMLRLQGPPDTGWCDGGVRVCEYPSHPFCFTGWLMHVQLPGRTVIYRIGKFRAVDNCWEASWPD